MLRAIREIQPRWIVGENVLGLVNWNGGMVFEEVQADLEAEGYEVQPYVLPAAAVGAPHRRDRVWFVAHAESMGRRRRWCETSKQWKDNIWESRCEGFGGSGIATNPSSDGFDDKPTTTNNIIGQDNIESGKQRERTIEGFGNEWNATDTEVESGRGELFKQQKQREFRRCNSINEYNNWDNFPTVSPIHTGDDGVQNRLDSITFSKWRNESIKAAGNAIVPQVVFQIFKAIHIFETQNLKQ
jgi:DNA (cytosine-5)-methyltransferase 1